MAEKTIVAEIDGVQRTIKADIPEGSTPEQIEGAVRDYWKAQGSGATPRTGTLPMQPPNPMKEQFAPFSKLRENLAKPAPTSEDMKAQYEKIKTEGYDEGPSYKVMMGGVPGGAGVAAGLGGVAKRALGVGGALATSYGVHKGASALGAPPWLSEILAVGAGLKVGSKLSPETAAEIEATLKSGGVKGLVTKWLSPKTAEALPRQTRQDIAFDLFKETHGAAPETAAQKIQAIREMGEALRTAKPAAAAKPAAQPKTYAPSTGVHKSPLDTPPEPPPPPQMKSGPGTGRSYYQAPKSTLDPSAKASPSGKLSGPAKATPKPEPAAAAASTETPKPSPSGTLTGPGEEKPIKYESVKRTDTGAELRRDNFKKGIAKDHPGLTREQFLKMTAREKNELIRKYNPQSVNRPYIENSKVFEEFADHVWPK